MPLWLRNTEKKKDNNIKKHLFVNKGKHYLN